ncbi:hypothetical protein LXL04_007300 [Taraxacum kok-saghyz]
MALQLNQVVYSQTFFSVYKSKQKLPEILKRNSRPRPLIKCANKNNVSLANGPSVIYKPTTWSHNFIQALDVKFSYYGECFCDEYIFVFSLSNISNNLIMSFDESKQLYYKEQLKELEKKAVAILNVDFKNGGLSTLQLLEEIDDIERLGLDYKFQYEIRRTLDLIVSENERHEEKESSLHAAS